MKTFADASNPLRCSSLPQLAQCATSVILRREHDDSGEAADTGSLIHAGIDAYHKTNDREVGEAVMAMTLPKFPRASTPKANRAYAAYVHRSKSAEWGKLIHSETAISFTLDPAEDDPTGEKIYVTGTRDQVREIDGNSLALVDIKTGAPKIEAMFNMYASQLAAYQYATMLQYPGKVIHAAILRTQDFIYGGPVLHYAWWAMDDIPAILEFVKHKVAAVRRGHLEKLHGNHCLYCPARNVRQCSRGIIPGPQSRELESGTLPDLDSLPSMGLGDI